MTRPLNRPHDERIKQSKGKPAMHLIHPDFIEDVARVRMFGNTKYDPETWVQVDPILYYDAALRHLNEWLRSYEKGEPAIDHESNLPTLAHAACNVYFLYQTTRKAKENKQ